MTAAEQSLARKLADAEAKLAAHRLILGVLSHILTPRDVKPNLVRMVNAAEKLKEKHRRGCVVWKPRTHD